MAPGVAGSDAHASAMGWSACDDLSIRARAAMAMAQTWRSVTRSRAIIFRTIGSLSSSSKVGSSNGSIGASTTYFSETNYRIFVTGMRQHSRPAVSVRRGGCREVSSTASRPERRRDYRRNECQSAACGEHAPVVIHVPVMVHREPAVSGIYVVTRPIDRCASGMLLHSTTRRRAKNRL
jgi:hypothetical protein